MSDNATSGTFEVLRHVLILDFKHDSGWQYPSPMLHQHLVGPVVATQFGEVVAIQMTFRKELGEAGETSVNRIAACVNDARVWQSQMDQPREKKVCRQLVNDALGMRREIIDRADITCTKLTQMLVIH